MQHNSSRATLAELTNTFVDSVSGQSVDELMGLSRDLLAAAEVLSAQPSLRRALADSTTEAGARTGLVQRLFSGQLSPAAVQALQLVAGASWSGGADLRDAVTSLARTAAFVAAERAGDLDRVEDELFRFGRAVDGNADLARVLDDPAGNPQGRVGLIRRLLDGKASPVTVELLSSAARPIPTRAFVREVESLTEHAASRKGTVVAEVTSAVELDADQQHRLTAALNRLYGRPVAIHVRVDENLQGGIRVTVGDEVIDGSVAGRLAALRRRLAG